MKVVLTFSGENYFLIADLVFIKVVLFWDPTCNEYIWLISLLDEDYNLGYFLDGKTWLVK